MSIYIHLFVAALFISPVFSNIVHTLRHNISVDNVPCEKGWYYFNDKCYKGAGRKMSQRLKWHDALDKCKGWGADLVSINSEEEQEFIVSFLQLDVHFRAWIGLHDLHTESDYKWSDESAFSYRNWNEGEPSGRRFGDEDCVQLVFEPWNDVVGKWNDAGCDLKNAYICEKITSSRRESADHRYCSSKEGGGSKYKSSCLHVVNKADSWENAEAHCKEKFNGHLVTIHDLMEDIFLDYVLGSMEKEVWIGIKIQEQIQQQWTSGWYVSYNGFGDELSVIEGACVARRRRREWIMTPCSRQFSFVCEVSRVDPNADAVCASEAVHKALIGVLGCIILVAILIGVVLYFFRPCGIEFLKKSSEGPSSQPKKYSSMKECILKKDSLYETMK